jgi:hypothetical protein
MAKRAPLPQKPDLQAWHGNALPDALRYTRFRSQLEIRFALGLHERALPWFYEPERLSEGRYLVDFYLPRCKCWVEVKGVVDSRDALVLRQVAVLLAETRKHRLYMWTANQAYLVGAGDFHPLSHEAFWAGLVQAAALNTEQA